MKYTEKNMKICELLGAKQFQKKVFELEKIKYGIIEKVFPNIYEWYDRYSKCKLERKLLKCNEINKEQIIDEYRFGKLLFRKELIYKQNENYHMDLDNPTNFINYLKFNKKVHVDGLKSNIILIIMAIIFKLIFNYWIFDLILIYNIISSIINLECINLQNYNLCRLENKQMKLMLETREKKIKDDKTKKYGDGFKVVGRTFRETEDIPQINDILGNIRTVEEKEQLLLYLRKQLAYLEQKNKNLKVKYRVRTR